MLNCTFLSGQDVDKEFKNKREMKIHKFYVIADSCYKSSNYNDALANAQKGKSIVGKWKKYSDEYFNLRELEALSYMSLEDYKSADSIFMELREKYPSDYSVLFYSGLCNSYLSNWEKAIEYYNVCINYLEELNLLQSGLNVDAEKILLSVKTNLVNAYIKIERYDLAFEVLYPMKIELKDKLSEEEYIDYLYYLAGLYGIPESAPKWIDKLLLDVLEELYVYNIQINEKEDACLILEHIVQPAILLGNYSLAYDYCKKGINLFNSLSENDKLSSFMTEYHFLRIAAHSASRLYKYSESYGYIERIEKFLLKHQERLNKQYNYYLENLMFIKGTIILDEGKSCKTAAAIFQKLLDSETVKNDTSLRISSLYNLGCAQLSYNLDSAFISFQSSLHDMSNKVDYEVIKPKVLNQLATILESKGEINQALSYYTNAINFFKRFSDSDNYSYLLTLLNASRCALVNGEYSKAIAWGEEARKIQLDKDIKLQQQDLTAWSILLPVYQFLENGILYNDRYNEYKIYSQNGDLNLDFGLMEIDKLYNNGQVEDALDLIYRLEKIHNTTIDKKEIILNNKSKFKTFVELFYNNVFDPLGLAYDLLFDCEYVSTNSLLRNFYNNYKNSHQYLLLNIYASYLNEDYSYCISIVDDVLDFYNKQMLSILGLTKEEKANYWRKVSYFKNLYGNIRKHSDETQYLYDISLLYKNFLINSEKVIFKALEKFDNNKIKLKCIDLKQTRERIIRVENSDIIDSLYLREINLLREIAFEVENVQTLNKYNKISCDTIAKELLPNEVAIEIVDYSTDHSKEYVALVLKQNWDKPICIELGDESSFLSYSSIPSIKLYNPDMPFNNELYNKIWEPILPYLNEIDVVYISPSGLLSTIAFEALVNSEGKYISDIYDIRRVSSTASILDFRSNEKVTYSSSCVFGGVNYNSVAAKNKTDNYAIGDYGYIIDRSVEQRIPYLEGTKREAEKTARLLSKNIEDVSLYIGHDATEDEFKNLSTKKPSIIHIATHGFYIPKSEVLDYNFYKDKEPTKNILSMERSGLLMAGSNDAWNGEFKLGIEDGVLTASEISELNLSDTKLVVMSACDTGLGEVTDDGIEGLQRGFKRAGVETIIMSLWKVDDKATETLMNEFYSCIIRGVDKNKALQIAKKKVRDYKKYRSPYYWAGFVMLD